MQSCVYHGLEKAFPEFGMFGSFCADLLHPLSETVEIVQWLEEVEWQDKYNHIDQTRTFFFLGETWSEGDTCVHEPSWRVRYQAGLHENNVAGAA